MFYIFIFERRALRAALMTGVMETEGAPMQSVGGGPNTTCAITAKWLEIRIKVIIAFW